VTKDAVKQAEENLRITRVKYEEGIGTGTEVLDAVSLLSVAGTNQYRHAMTSESQRLQFIMQQGKISWRYTNNARGKNSRETAETEKPQP